MIHLIWTKDTNATTVEDGKEVKGIRQKLLECYKHLYFVDVENLDPRSQVKRIAKNLVELVSPLTTHISLLTLWRQAHVLCNPR